jgi:hypothetical protein
MRRLLILAMTLGSSLASGQGGFETVIPSQPVHINADADASGYAYTTGHWVPIDKSDKKSELAGPSTSEITCDRPEKVCHETQANMTVMDHSFSLSADYIEYKVVRWNAKEIVAQNVNGLCRALNVLKFDLVQKRVYYSQTLSEPDNNLPKVSKDLCDMIGMNLELKASTMWRKEPK